MLQYEGSLDARSENLKNTYQSFHIVLYRSAKQNHAKIHEVSFNIAQRKPV